MFCVVVVSSDSFNRLSHLLSFVNIFYFSVSICLIFPNQLQATACLLYHIFQPFVNNFFQVIFLSVIFLSFDLAKSLRTFHYPAKAVRYVVFCIGCFSDEDYLTTAVLNCQRFSCFLFISHNSDNSFLLFILYTKYLFSIFIYNKLIL